MICSCVLRKKVLLTVDFLHIFSRSFCFHFMFRPWFISNYFFVWCDVVVWWPIISLPPGIQTPTLKGTIPNNSLLINGKRLEWWAVTVKMRLKKRPGPLFSPYLLLSVHFSLSLSLSALTLREVRCHVLSWSMKTPTRQGTDVSCQQQWRSEACQL